MKATFLLILFVLQLFAEISDGSPPKYGKANFVDDLSEQQYQPQPRPQRKQEQTQIPAFQQQQQQQFAGTNFQDQQVDSGFFGFGQKSSPNTRNYLLANPFSQQETLQKDIHPFRSQDQHPSTSTCVGMKNMKLKFDNSSIDGNVRIIFTGHAEPSEFFSVFSGTSIMIFGTFGANNILGPSEIIVKIEDRSVSHQAGQNPFIVLESHHIDTRCSSQIRTGAVFGSLIVEEITMGISHPASYSSAIGSSILGLDFHLPPLPLLSENFWGQSEDDLDSRNHGNHHDDDDDDNDHYHHHHHSSCEHLSIAICIDTSACVGSRSNGGNVSNIVDIKHALKNSIISKFSGTQTQIALYSYATHASRVLDYTNVQENIGVNSLNSAIDWLHFETSSPEWYRNWEDMFDLLIKDSSHGTTPDVVIFITTGDPNIHNNSPFVQGQYVDDVAAGVSKARTFSHYFPHSKILSVVVGSLGINHSHNWHHRDDDDHDNDDDDNYYDGDDDEGDIHNNLEDCHIYNLHRKTRHNDDDNDDDDHGSENHYKHNRNHLDGMNNHNVDDNDDDDDDDDDHHRPICCTSFVSASAIQRISGPLYSKDYFVAIRFDQLESTLDKTTQFICCPRDRDSCGKCHGDDSDCMGCDNIPNSGNEFDICGVCGGDGDSCDIPPCSNEASISIRDETFFKIIHHPNPRPCQIEIHKPEHTWDSHNSGRSRRGDDGDDDDDEQHDISTTSSSSSSSSSEWTLLALPGEWSLEEEDSRDGNDDQSEDSCSEDIFEFIYKTNYFHDTAVLLSFNPYRQCNLFQRDECDNRQICEPNQVDYCDLFTVDFPSGRWIKHIDHVKMIVTYSANFTLEELIGCGSELVLAGEIHNRSKDNNQDSGNDPSDDDNDDHHQHNHPSRQEPPVDYSSWIDYKFTGNLYATLLKANNCTHHHHHNTYHKVGNDLNSDDEDDDDRHQYREHQECEHLLYEKMHQFELIIKNSSPSNSHQEENVHQSYADDDNENDDDDDDDDDNGQWNVNHDSDRYDIISRDVDAFSFKSEWKKNVWLQCGDVVVEFTTKSKGDSILSDAKIILEAETGIPFHLIHTESVCVFGKHHGHSISGDHDDDTDHKRDLDNDRTCIQHWKMRSFGGAGIVDFSGRKPVQFAVKVFGKRIGYITVIVDLTIIKNVSPLVHDKFGAKLLLHSNDHQSPSSHNGIIGSFSNTFQPCDTIEGELVLLYKERCEEYFIDKVEICYARGSPLLPYNPLYPLSTGCATSGTRCDSHVIFDRHSPVENQDFSFRLIGPHTFEFVPKIVSKFPQLIKVSWSAIESSHGTNHESKHDRDDNNGDSNRLSRGFEEFPIEQSGNNLQKCSLRSILELQRLQPHNNDHFAYSFNNYPQNTQPIDLDDITGVDNIQEAFHNDGTDSSARHITHNSNDKIRGSGKIFTDVYHLQYVVNVREEHGIFHHSPSSSSHGCHGIIWGDDGEDGENSHEGHSFGDHHTWWRWACFPLFTLGVLICICICVINRPRKISNNSVIIGSSQPRYRHNHY